MDRSCWVTSSSKAAVRVRKALDKLLSGAHLSQAEAALLLTQLTAPDTHPAVIGAVLAALRAKGVVADELRGFADGMRALALRPRIPADLRAIDVNADSYAGILCVNRGCGADGGDLKFEMRLRGLCVDEQRETGGEGGYYNGAVHFHIFSYEQRWG